MIARRTVLLGAGAMLLPVSGRGESVPLRIACRDDPDPMWVQPDGLAIRVLDEIVARRAGCRLAYVPLPWQRAIDSVLAGSNDALFTVFRPALLDRFVITPSPLLRLKTAVVYRRDHPALAQLEAAPALEDLRPLTMVIFQNDVSMTERATAYGPYVTMSGTLDSLFRGVVAGRGDFAYLLQYRAERLIQTQGLGGVLAVRPVEWATIEWRFGIRLGFPGAAALIPRIDAATGQAQQDGTIDRLFAS
jgi:ABC-type amino acid transport substrate-binding protein